MMYVWCVCAGALHPFYCMCLTLDYNIYNLSTITINQKRERTPVWLTDMVVTDAIGRNYVLSFSIRGIIIFIAFSVGVFLRIEIYLPVLDKASSELYRRFSGENQNILRAVEAFIPGFHSCSQSYSANC